MYSRFMFPTVCLPREPQARAEGPESDPRAHETECEGHGSYRDPENEDLIVRVHPRTSEGGFGGPEKRPSQYASVTS